MCFHYLYSDGYGFYEELQRNVEICNEDVKKLLQDYGNKCKQHEVCDFFFLSVEFIHTKHSDKFSSYVFKVYRFYFSLSRFRI